MTQHIKNLSAASIFLLAGFYTVLITIVLLMPVKSSADINFPIDKVVHVCIHFGLIICWLEFACKKHAQLSIRYFFLIFFLCLSYGIIIEVLQEQFTSTRKADFWDVIANMLGSILGMIFFYKRNHFFKVKDE